MASKITFECPHCLAKLSVTDRSKIEKKIRCPKCKEIFLPEVPDNDDLESFEDEPEEEPEERPGKKKGTGAEKGKAKGGKNKKGTSASGGSSLPLIIGGGVLVLILAGVGVYFSGLLGGKATPAPVAAPQNPNPQQMAGGLAPTAHEAPRGQMPNQDRNDNTSATASVPQTNSASPVPTSTASVPSTPAKTPITEAEKVLGLRWMNADTDVLVHLKVASLFESPLLKGPLSLPAAVDGMKEFEKKIGIHPSDLDTVTLGLFDFSGTSLRALASAPPSNPNGFPQSPFGAMQPSEIRGLLVVKSKKPIDLELLSKQIPNAAIKDKSGKKYFEVLSASPMEIGFAGWSPNSNTLIMGSVKELIESMDRGETVQPRKEFAPIDYQSHLIIANVNNTPDEATLKKLESQQQMLTPMLANARQMNAEYSLQMGGIGLTVKGGIDFQLFVTTGTTSGADKVKQVLTTQVEQARAMFNMTKATAPPLLAELGEILLSNVKIDDQNQILKLSTSVPDSEQSKLEQLPAIVMMMAMTGGFGGMGGGMPMAGGSGFGQPMEMTAFKLPGETDAVEAASVEGLPEGMTINARTSWGQMNFVDGKPVTTVDVMIDVQGEGVEHICASTSATSKTAKLDSGSSLKKAKLLSMGEFDPQKAFSPFDVDDNNLFMHPPKTLRVRLTVDAPPANAKKIELFEGSFKFLTSTESRKMTIENAPQRAKKVLTEPEFKAAGLKLLRGEPGASQESLRLSCAKTHFVGQVRATPGDMLSFTEVDKGATIQRIYCNDPNGKFPTDLQLEFKLYADVKEEVITFKFENIPLPSPDTKPTFDAQPGLK